MANNNIDIKKPPQEVIPHVPLEEYKKRFEGYIDMTRTEDGILIAKMNYHGDTAKWVNALHYGLGDAFKYIGDDPENQVVILTGTNEHWLGGYQEDYMEWMFEASRKDPRFYATSTYDVWWGEGVPLLENLLWHIHVPTIAAMNGPSLIAHFEIPLCCDLTLCTPDTTFYDHHYDIHLAPGDSNYLILQKLLGEKRANYMLYMNEAINAEEALRLGLVNEVVEREDLMDRAMQIAKHILRTDYYTRRLTHTIITREWRSWVEKHFLGQYAMQTWAGCLEPSDPDKGNRHTHNLVKEK